MFRWPLASLGIACTLLAVTFVAAEELAGGAVSFAGRAAPAAILAAPSLIAPAKAPASAEWPPADPPLTTPGVTDASEKLCRICRITAYCQRGTTAAGVPAGVGQCAAPADIPLGSTVYIPAIDRTFVVTDRTHRRFRHNTVDLFIPSKHACRKFGRHYLECEFTLVAEPAPYGTLRLPRTGS